MEELCLAVPTQGTKYTLRCNCWLAKDRGDGVTSRVFDLLDAMVVNIGVKVWRVSFVQQGLFLPDRGSSQEDTVREAGGFSWLCWLHFFYCCVTLGMPADALGLDLLTYHVGMLLRCFSWSVPYEIM